MKISKQDIEDQKHYLLNAYRSLIKDETVESCAVRLLTTINCLFGVGFQQGYDRTTMIDILTKAEPIIVGLIQEAEEDEAVKKKININ